VVICAKMAELTVMPLPFGLWAETGKRNHKVDGVQIPMGGEIWGEGAPIVKYRELLPWAVQKWLNRSICRLGCGLRWARGSTSSVIFVRWHQYALIYTTELSICCGDGARH